MRRRAKYTAARWGFRLLSLLAVAAVLGVLTEMIDPYLPISALPYGRVLGTMLFAGIAYGSHKASYLVDARQWEEAGQSVGLTPMEGELRETLSHRDRAPVSRPILSGQIQGRTVRARIQDRTSSQNSAKRSATLVEVDLDQPVEDGVIVNRAGEGLVTIIATGPNDVEIVEDDPNVPGPMFAALANEPALGRAILSGRSRDALDAMEEFDQLLVGNAEEVFRDALPDYEDKIPDIGGFSLGSALGGGFKSLISGDRFHGDAATVTHRAPGKVLNAEELERQARAVVAAADAFERAREEM